MKKVYSLILVLSICAAAIFAAVSANAADKATVSFNAQTQYKASAAYAEPINTFEAVVNLPENFNSSTRGGVIIGNYGYGNPNVSFEIHNSGRPRLYITEPSGNVTNLIFNQINVATGKDTHIAIVRDAAAKKA